MFDLIAIFFSLKMIGSNLYTLTFYVLKTIYDPALIFERSGFDFTQLSIDRILALKKQSLYLHA